MSFHAESFFAEKNTKIYDTEKPFSGNLLLLNTNYIVVETLNRESIALNNMTCTSSGDFVSREFMRVIIWLKVRK